MRNPYLCIAIIVFLGVGGLAGIGGMIALAVLGRQTPEALVAIVSGAFGALSSFLVLPPRGSIGVSPWPTGGTGGAASEAQEGGAP